MWEHECSGDVSGDKCDNVSPHLPVASFTTTVTLFSVLIIALVYTYRLEGGRTIDTDNIDCFVNSVR